MAPSSSGPGRPQWHERRTAPHAIGEHSSSTARWNDVPRGTMDEVSSFVRLDLPSLWRQGRHLDCSASSSNPIMEGPWCRFRREARARERHRHRSDGSLKALDPDRPIREADITVLATHMSAFDRKADIGAANEAAGAHCARHQCASVIGEPNDSVLASVDVDQCEFAVRVPFFSVECLQEIGLRCAAGTPWCARKGRSNDFAF